MCDSSTLVARRSDGIEVRSISLKKAETASLRFQSPGNRHCPLSPSFSAALNSLMLEWNQKPAPASRSSFGNLNEQNLLPTQQDRTTRWLFRECQRNGLLTEFGLPAWFGLLSARSVSTRAGLASTPPEPECAPLAAASLHPSVRMIWTCLFSLLLGTGAAHAPLEPGIAKPLKKWQTHSVDML